MDWLHEIRYSLRALRHRPGMTLAALLALMLGIGANVTIFSVVHGVLLAPLPYPDPGRLMMVWEGDKANPERRLGAVSEATFEDLRRRAGAFAALGAVRNTSFSLTGLEVPETPLMHRVTADYLPLLGIEPLFGRFFTAAEDQPGGPRVALLSYGLWQRHFGGDEEILGRAIELDHEPYEVIGVMPQGFRSPFEPAPPQLWLPMAADPAALDRRQRPYLVYGRLAAGVPPAAARQEIARIGEDLARQHPEISGPREGRLEEVKEVVVGSFRPALLTVAAAVGLVLLIACGNVAHLLLARAMDRRREIAIRIALGASRGVLLRQFGMESLILSLAGGLLGVALAWAVLDPLVALVPQAFDVPRLDGVAIDLPVLGFALALALATGLFFGFAPAQVAFARTAHHDALSAGSVRSTTGRRGHSLRGVLVIAEVALSFVLLTGASLMVQSFLGLSRSDPGFDAEGVLTLRSGLRGESYAEPRQRAEFFRRTLERLRALPGVESAAAINRLPPTLLVESERFSVEGAPAVAIGQEPESLVRVVTPDFFATLRTPLVEGRDFEPRDDAEAPAVAIISRLFAELHLADGPRLGRGLNFTDGRRVEVIGVVGDVRTLGNPPDPRPILYLPHAQQSLPVLSFVVRTAGDPLALVPAVRRAIARQDPMLPVYAVQPLARDLANADWQPRFTMQLLSLLALLALILALIGTYAVLSSDVAERRREFGIRMTFGARRGDIVWVVLRGALRRTAIGLAIGLTVTWISSRLLEAQLYGVSGTDPLTYGGIAFLLTVVAAGASAMPALRATRVDPVTVLQEP